MFVVIATIEIRVQRRWGTEAEDDALLNAHRWWYLCVVHEALIWLFSPGSAAGCGDTAIIMKEAKLDPHTAFKVLDGTEIGRLLPLRVRIAVLGRSLRKMDVRLSSIWLAPIQSQPGSRREAFVSHRTGAFGGVARMLSRFYLTRNVLASKRS